MSHLNNYYESPADYDPMEITIRPAVFLAGGITGCPDWQAQARRLINNSGRVVGSGWRKREEEGGAGAAKRATSGPCRPCPCPGRPSWIP